MKNLTEYTYNNVLSISTWPKGNETEKNIKRKSGGFQTIFVPIAFNTDTGYSVLEVNIDSDDPYFLQFLGKAPERFPISYVVPIYPLGFKDIEQEGKPQAIKYANCKDVYKTKNALNLSELKTQISKESINQVADIRTIKISGKRQEVIQLEIRSKVTLTGYMEGKGTESETRILTTDTRELLQQIVNFEYEYRTGEPGERYDESMKGKYVKTLTKKSKFTTKDVTFYDHIKASNKVSYFSDKNGIFVPVTLNTLLKTNLHIDPSSSISTIEYPYYMANIKSAPKNYFYPFESLNMGGNLILYPHFNIEYINEEKDIDYKIPGKIGGDILSLGILNLNDEKRELSFFDEWTGSIPEKAILFKHKNKVPVFDAMVNSSTINATIAFDCYDPELSYKIKDQLGLKTRKLLKDNNVVEKAQIILTPPHSNYSNVEAVIKDFGDAPYDLKLCLDYIKGKIAIINYIHKWLLVDSPTAIKHVRTTNKTKKTKKNKK